MTLESLNAMSNDALLEAAENLGIEIPKGLERPFVIGEILDAMDDQAYEGQAAADAAPEAGRSEKPAAGVRELEAAEAQAGLAPRYNETGIHALIRDPTWAYIYWDMRDVERSAVRDGDQRGLVIRALELASPSEQPQNALSWFEFEVSVQDGEWYVNLPDDGSSYVFELCARSAQDRRLIARSNAVTAPRVRSREDFDRLPRRTRNLMELAGLYDQLCSETPQDSGRRIIPPGTAED